MLSAQPMDENPNILSSVSHLYKIGHINNLFANVLSPLSDLAANVPSVWSGYKSHLVNALSSMVVIPKLILVLLPCFPICVC